MNTNVILLRRVMPVGKHELLMAPLRVALSKAGLQDVRTYIQSGNVVARSTLPQPALEQLVHDAILNELGPDLSIVARTARQFRQLIERNPFTDADRSLKRSRSRPPSRRTRVPESPGTALRLCELTNFGPLNACDRREYQLRDAHPRLHGERRASQVDQRDTQLAAVVAVYRGGGVGERHSMPGGQP
jgi:uncharacterized membrane protein YccC